MPQAPQPCRVEELLEHTEWVRRLAYSLVKCEAAADDLVQQTFLTAIEHPPQNQGATRGWLARVLRNLAVDRSRRRLRRQLREEKAFIGGGGGDLSNAELLPVEIQSRLELQELMAAAVKDLPDPYRTMVVLYYFDDLSSAQIAKKLKLNPSTVRNQLRRGREQIRKRLEGQYGNQWATMCVSLLLRPFSASSSLLPIGWSALLNPALAGVAVLVGASMWNLWAPSAAVPEGGNSSSAVLAEAELDESSNQPKVDSSTAQRISDPAHLRHELGISVTDFNFQPLLGAECRVYAMRKPIPAHELLGPEALRFASFPVLASGVSDADGTVHLNIPTPSPDLPEPQLCIVAEKPGYTKRALLLQPLAEENRFQSRISIELQSGKQHRFQVVDESGRAIPNARVAPACATLDRLDPHFQSFFAATDSDGFANFSSLHQEVVGGKSWAPGFQTTHFDLKASSRAEEAQLIVLKRGLEANLSVYADGKPFAGARVFLRQGRNLEATLHGSREEEGYLGETDVDGSLHVAGLDAQLRSDLIVKIGGVEERVKGVEAGEHYSVDFPPIRSLSGRAICPDGSPASCALVMVVDPLSLSTRHLSTTWSNEDGTFDLHVKEGAFAFAIIHPSSTLLVSDLQRANGNLALGDLQLPASSPLRLKLVDANGQAVASGGRVKLLRDPELAVPQFGRPQLLQSIWPTGLQTVLPFQHSASEFTFQHLPPGSYWLQVRADGFQDQLCHVELSAGGAEQIIQLERGLDLAVQLLDEQGQAQGQRDLVLSPASYDWHWRFKPNPQRPQQRPRSAYSDDQGELAFTGLAPGKWRLSLPSFGEHGLFLAEFDVTESGHFGQVRMPAHGKLMVSTESSHQVYSQSRIQLTLTGTASWNARTNGGRTWRRMLQTTSNGSTDAVEVVAGDYRLRSLVPRTLPRDEQIKIESAAIHHHQVKLFGNSIHGSLPAGVSNGQVILVERNAGGSGLLAADQVADTIHKRLRKVVRHPPAPGLGGFLQGRTAEGVWRVRYASCQVGPDSAFAFQHLPDGEYWLLASANGYRVAGPFDINLANGVPTAPSLGNNLDLQLTPGAGFRLHAPGLLDLLQQDPKARLLATVQVGPALDQAPGDDAKSAAESDLDAAPRTDDVVDSWQAELKPADGPVLEIDKDRPRHYQITFQLTRGNGKQVTWTVELQTQAGLIEELQLQIPE